jgi:hypothetical protein
LEQGVVKIANFSQGYLKVKRLGEGGTQTFDVHILPEFFAEIKGC